MSDNSGILGEILEQGGSIVKQTANQVKQVPGGFVKGVAGQVVGGGDSQVTAAEQIKEKAETEEFVKELYSPSDAGKNAAKKDLPADATHQALQAGQEVSELTDEQKIEKLKQELHSKYYQDTFNPQKQEEERPAEKVEREEMQDLQAEKKKEDEKPDFALQKAKQRVEKNPGASG